MKITDTALIVGALAVAAGLVLLPRRAAGAMASASGPGLPRVGGTAGSLWTAGDSARYREQLARETGSDWMGP